MNFRSALHQLWSAAEGEGVSQARKAALSSKIPAVGQRRKRGDEARKEPFSRSGSGKFPFGGKTATAHRIITPCQFSTQGEVRWPQRQQQ